MEAEVTEDLSSDQHGAAKVDSECANHKDNCSSGIVANGSACSVLSDDQASAQSTEKDHPSTKETEMISVVLIWGTQKYNQTLPLDLKISELKTEVEQLTGVLPSMQKLMFQGLMKDDSTLRECKVKPGSRIMVIGSKAEDIAAVRSAASQPAKFVEESASASKEPLSKQTMHAKVISKGIPSDAMPGILKARESLPQFPITGMLNKAGKKVRLTFKLEQDEVWIGTNERTDKIPMSQIKEVVNEPIHDHPEYCIVGLQLGPTSASMYWFYWVPQQYVAAIKNAILQ